MAVLLGPPAGNIRRTTYPHPVGVGRSMKKERFEDVVREKMNPQLKAYKKRKERSKERSADRHALAVIDASPRQCEGCTACCHTHGIKELGKPYFQPCEHLCEAGCGIHGNHPRSCQVFACAWRGNLNPTLDADKPDKIGIVAELLEISVPGVSGAGAWYCYEVWPGASNSPEAIALFERLSVYCPSLIFRHGDPEKYRIYGTGVHGTRKVRL